MLYLTTHSTHFIYGYMASDIWLRTILIVRKETRCRHIGYSYRLAARVLLYAPSHRQDNTYHGLCYTSRGALAGTINSSMGSPHEGSVWRPTAPCVNALPLSYVPLQQLKNEHTYIIIFIKNSLTKQNPTYKETTKHMYSELHKVYVTLLAQSQEFILMGKQQIQIKYLLKCQK